MRSFFFVVAIGAQVCASEPARTPIEAFVPAGASAVVVDLRTGSILTRVGPDADRAHPLGSLVKPFLAAAAGRTGGLPDSVVCAPTSVEADQLVSCWEHRGHGAVHLDRALALSCNRYFTVTGRNLDPVALADLFGAVGIAIEDGKQLDPERLAAGIEAIPGARPTEILFALDALLQGVRRTPSGTLTRLVDIPRDVRDAIRHGLSLGTAIGTSESIGRKLPGEQILSKTGTWTVNRRFWGAYAGIHETRRIAIMVVVPGGRGPTDAVPIAASIWDALLKNDGAAKTSVGLHDLSPRRKLSITAIDGNIVITDRRGAERTMEAGEMLRAREDGVMDFGGMTLEPPIRISGGTLQIDAELGRRTINAPVRVTRSGGRWRIIASMDIEDVLARAVIGEMGHASPAALEAMAVVGRTFLLREIGRHRSEDFDVCDNTHCLRLLEPVSDRCRTAVEKTKGSVLRSADGRLSEDAYMHASCGGVTATPDAVWSSARDGTACGVVDVSCNNSPGCRWVREISAADFRRALDADSIALTEHGKFEIAARDRAGRALSFLCGNNVINADRLRLAVGRSLGWEALPSSFVEIQSTDDGFFFSGRGIGHGVGLCQEGAIEMAAQGASCDVILRKFFSSGRR